MSARRRPLSVECTECIQHSWVFKMQICVTIEIYLIIILGIKIINKIIAMHCDSSIKNDKENTETNLHTAKHFHFAELGSSKPSDTTNSV